MRHIILGLPPFMKARAAKARCRLFDSLHDIEDEPEGVPEVATARGTRLHLTAGNLKLQSGTRRVGDVEGWNERTQGVLVSVHVEPQSSALDFQASVALADQAPAQHTDVEGLSPIEVGHVNRDLGVGCENGLLTLQQLRQLPQFRGPPALIFLIIRHRTKARLA